MIPLNALGPRFHEEEEVRIALMAVKFITLSKIILPTSARFWGPPSLEYEFQTLFVCHDSFFARLEYIL